MLIAAIERCLCIYYVLCILKVEMHDKNQQMKKFYHFKQY